jgi:hypothetical protein
MGDAIDWSVFPCGLGDVVVRTIDGAEAWAGGAIVLLEDAPAAVLFIAPDASGERAIYARPRPVTDLGWLTPIPRDAIVVGPEPPSALEIGRTRFDRKRRLPLRTRRLGSGAPEVGATAVLGEYTSASGDLAIVLAAEGVSRVWTGRRLGDDEYEVWRGGKSD